MTHGMFVVLQAGCTNLRRLIFIVQGLIPEETAKMDTISEQVYLAPAIRKASFINLSLTEREKAEKLKTYYKFMMVRNPLERLLSSYRDKIEPLLYFNSSHVTKEFLLKENIRPQEMEFFEAHRRWILTKYRPLDLMRWVQNRGAYNLQLTFSDFVQWIVDSDDDTLNEHFSTTMSNAHPCTVRYHFYANFKNYSREVKLLVQKLNTTINFFTDHNSHHPWEETRVLLKKYYSQLSPELKYHLFKWIYKELDFYYHLYPEEQWSHADLLGILEPVLEFEHSM